MVEVLPYKVADCSHRHAGASTPAKRHILIKTLAAGACAAGAFGLYMYASRVATKRYRLEHVYLRAASNGDSLIMVEDPVNFNGDTSRYLKILHISDLHLSEPETCKIDFLQAITQDEYDLVFLSGDIFENYTGLPYSSKILSRQPKLGAYAVLGNHDYYDYTWINKTIGRVWRQLRTPLKMRNVQPLIKALEFAGFQVLRDEIRSFANHNISLIGIDYPTIATDKMKELVADIPSHHLRLALFHKPRKLHIMSQSGIHLAFGGHTHGGQVRLPGIGALVTDSDLKREEASGLVRRDNTLFHISRGLSADPKTNFRLFCPPAATVVHVRY